MKIFSVFLISFLFFVFPRAESTGSVFFIDSTNNQFLRSQSSNDVAQIVLITSCYYLFTSESMLLAEVGATVSVLLGFAPLTTLSAAGSSKLNEVLIPNPFNRPRAVFMLEVSGIDDPLVVDPKNAIFGRALKSSVDLGSSKADIQLLDEEEVSVISLDEPLGDYTEEDIIDFKAHKEFVSKLLALYRNIRKAMEKHGHLSKTLRRPAEIIMGSFDGIKPNCLIILIDDRSGQIVGVVVFNGVPHPESKTLMNVIYTSRSSPRWLADTKSSANTTLAAQVLVRRTLAWITGVVLLIATLLGVYFLLNMPLTRDTLLYSNVKLD
ncbi:Protein grpE [Gossypium australe]|uniref:Protein grpE n=1 Tax=Gossypium australe TaxID=47621 RepID=A0A5B6WF62_9ROSI|nr:Protein grpE [Gossypium australe]